jgi:hypothetical protein
MDGAGPLQEDNTFGKRVQRHVVNLCGFFAVDFLMFFLAATFTSVKIMWSCPLSTRCTREKSRVNSVPVTMVPLILTAFSNPGPSAEDYWKDTAASSSCFNAVVKSIACLRIIRQHLIFSLGQGCVVFRHNYQSLARIIDNDFMIQLLNHTRNDAGYARLALLVFLRLLPRDLCKVVLLINVFASCHCFMAKEAL